MTYVSLPITVNGQALIEEAFAELEAQIAGWEPAEGNAEVFLIRATALRLVQPLAELASEVGDLAFAAWGEQIVQVFPHYATPAIGKAKFTVQDALGYQIPAGTQISVATSGSTSVGFVTAVELTIPPGSTSGEVAIEAVEAGTEGNELSGAAILLEALNFVTAVEITEATHNGEEAEEGSVYLSRLQETMQTLAPRPILARDVAILARTVAGIQRAGVIDNYNAETAEAEKEKTTSVYPVSAVGAAVSTPLKEALKALLAAKREANFVFIVADPTVNEISVKATVVHSTGYSAAEAKAQTEAALKELLDPALWGRGTSQDTPPTVLEAVPKLYFQDVVTAINNVQAVERYTVLEIKLGAGAYGTTDLTLSGKMPLPKVKTLEITGT